MDAGNFSGAVTLVARSGKIAHLEAQGRMDIQADKPMTKDAMFRIMSMTKPVVGVAILMMKTEEGKVWLNDPISRFIPEFKDQKVGVLLPNQPAAPAGQRGTAPKFYTVPAEREITVKDLLTHTSGLVSGPIGNSESAKVALKDDESNADFVPDSVEHHLNFSQAHDGRIARQQHSTLWFASSKLRPGRSSTHSQVSVYSRSWE